LINENADLVAENYRYVMRIVGGDTEGKVARATAPDIAATKTSYFS
jgi:hypothetical protein